ncbi:hypothetical protein BSKO_05493 [Bryopsis sp. KO-2023]|nr:hypothetical protein BSKO_05493 [Bryopsis sp. KO-2023]
MTARMRLSSSSTLRKGHPEKTAYEEEVVAHQYPKLAKQAVLLLRSICEKDASQSDLTAPAPVTFQKTISAMLASNGINNSQKKTGKNCKGNKALTKEIATEIRLVLKRLHAVGKDAFFGLALQDSEARLDQSDHLIEELKSRLVESIAQSEGKDEQASHLKLGLNTALEKIRILQEEDQSLSRQLRVSELEKSVSDLKANKKKEIKEVQLELESKRDEMLTLRKEISSVKSENDKVIMGAKDLRVELVMERRAIDSKRC